MQTLKRKKKKNKKSNNFPRCRSEEIKNLLWHNSFFIETKAENCMINVNVDVSQT